MKKIRQMDGKKRIRLLPCKRRSTREKAAKNLAVFLLFMLLCTMISRGIYAYRMPRVAVGQASSKTISHTLCVEGSIEPARETAVVLAEGIRIREICVKAGGKVEADTTLLYLDEADLKKQMEGSYEKIRVKEEKIAAMGRSNSADQSSLMEEQYALVHLREQYDAYQKLWKKKGRIESGADGYVTEVLVKAGDRTPDSAAMLLAVGADASAGQGETGHSGVSGQWIFRAELTEEQAGKIQAGDRVRLQFQEGRIQEDHCPVAAVRRTGKGTYEADISVTEKDLSPGEKGTMELTSQSGQYLCCVPLSALYSDGNKSYVLLIRETETILGTELSVVRRDVAVEDRDESTAALADGMLGAEEQFVVYADKEASSGDKVRLFEEEDLI